MKISKAYNILWGHAHELNIQYIWIEIERSHKQNFVDFGSEKCVSIYHTNYQIVEDNKEELEMAFQPQVQDTRKFKILIGWKYSMAAD